MSIEAHISNWKKAVAGWDFAAWPEVIEASSEQEFYLWCRLLNDATAKANAAGHNARGRGTGKKGEKQTMWITAKEYSLKIAYTPRPRQQAVTETSRAAYWRLDFTTQRGQVAAFILDKTLKAHDITRQEIAAWSGLPINVVCGRVNELLKEPIETAAGLRVLKVVGARLSNLPGAKDKNEALRFVEWREEGESQQMQLF